MFHLLSDQMMDEKAEMLLTWIMLIYAHLEQSLHMFMAVSQPA